VTGCHSHVTGSLLFSAARQPQSGYMQSWFFESAKNNLARLESSSAALAVALSLIFGIIVILWIIGGHFLSSGILVDVMMKNPILQAIIIPSTIGAFLYVLNLAGNYVFSNDISPYLYSYITIRSSESEYFVAVLDFVQDQRLLKAGHLMACKSKGKSWKESMQQFLTGEKVLTDIHYRPANTGSFMSMKYKGQTIYITRKSGDTETDGWVR
jgi:hypothetical protein